VKWLFSSILLLISVRVEAQTFVAPSQEYALSFYMDSEGVAADSAVSDLGVPSRDSRSFRIRVHSKKRAVYADSWGSRLICSVVSGSIRCEERASFVDDAVGVQCTISVLYLFSGSRRGGSWNALFREYMQCEDGWYRSLEYSGRARVRAAN
jgi:hypothetical protein